MKFHTLEIENFGSIKQAKVDFADQGLVLILGDNQDAAKADSNGAGKSLILEAFTWVLWGKTIRGGDFSGDGVVNRFVGKNCRVKLHIEDEDGTDYTVERTRKHTEGDKPNDLRVFRYVPDIWHEITRASVAQTQEMLIEIVGMDYTTFCVMMPGCGVRASEMTDKEVKLLLERLLQTQVLGTAHELVKTRLKEAQHEYDKAKTSRDALEQTLEEDEKRLQALKDKSDNYTADKAQKDRDLVDQIDKTLVKLEEQQAILQRAEDVEKRISTAQGKVNVDQKAITEAQRNQTATVESLNEDRAVIDKRKAVAQAEYNRINKQITSMPSGGDCPTCLQTVGEEHVADVTSGLREQSALISSQLVDIAQELTDVDEKLQQARDQFHKSLDTLKRTRDLHQTDLQKLQALQYEANMATKLGVSLQDQLEDLRTRRAALKTEEDPFVSLIMQTAKGAYEKAAEAARAYKTMNELDHKIAIMDYWLTGFSPQGVRSFMLEHVTPLLNKAAQRYANLLTDGEMSVTFHTQKRLKSGKVVEKFNIVVEQAHGGGSYSSASKGERARANLVIAFALGDLAALRAHRTVSFRFLDEPFESVDESGTDAIVALLNDQKERFDTVFVITHQDHFKQLFPKKLIVTKRNSETTLAGEHG